MANAALKAEVDELREILTELGRASLRSDLAIVRLTQGVEEFKDEMSEFKDEMSEFKDEMSEFKDEMSEFKDEMRRYREESEQDRKRMNKQWGALANKMGTLVEDIVAPNLPRVAAELLGCIEPEMFAVRVVRHFGGETREYDALVVSSDLVLVNETKSRLLVAHVDGLLAKLEELPRVIPEYAGRRLVGVLASLAVDPGVVAYATRHGMAVMAMGEETMQVLNPEALRADA